MKNVIPTKRQCVEGSGQIPRLQHFVLSLGMTLLLFPGFNSVHAEPSTYSPETCEFSVTFPGEPYTVQRCENGDDDRCYNLVSYTQTYELNATVNFRVICNPIGPKIQKKYDESVSKSAVRAMGKKNALKTFETHYREEKEYRHASLVGEGRVGRTPMIYLAQLWVGQASVMSVEAELIGDPFEEADKLFSNVMASVGLKKTKDAPSSSNEDPKESSSDTP